MLALLFILLLPAVAVALTIYTPDQPIVSASTFIIRWNAVYGDVPNFTVELVNAAFNHQYAIANNVNSGNGDSELTILLPAILPGRVLRSDGFTLQLVNPWDINDVYTESGQFAVASVPSTTTTGKSSTGASGSTTTSASASTMASTTNSSSSSSLGVTHSGTITTHSSTSSATSSSASAPSKHLGQSFNAATSARSGFNMDIAGALAAVLGYIITL
ncbi:uncharacterized protein BT62DRAFT_1079803 [Guyanagaster necrorhizus]|uniref:Uncharacterized protein n=1 Tax=Guyanagaster necrorhizus TaxID=856835 RepID=A0A9P8ANF8_9AGAR|nr:uncharacterized protein BT62DRAFT_1079803 [Guyanagaster necrorhizus MCA 3950]KAG7441860.1 hypothetical protein BT62DRAFT_1079803 [Guyanagaster necrorhizus MCA 3950]